MAQTIASGSQQLQYLKLLATHGVLTAKAAAELRDDELVQARRYLNTLVAEGFAYTKEGKFYLGIEGYQLPLLYAKHLSNEINQMQKGMNSFLSCIGIDPMGESHGEKQK